MGLFDRFTKKGKENKNFEPNNDLENLKEKQRTQQNKLWDKEYYGSEESKIKANEIKELKNEYLKNNPNDFLTRGVDLYKITWSAIDRMPDDERKIIELTGKGLYYENDLNQYEEAIKIYKEADELTLIVKKDEIAQLTEEFGEKDYLYCGELRNRVKMCEIKNHRSKIKDLEIKAKELEKTDPTQAIELYNKLNILNPNLKKYDKRIEKLNKK